MNKLSNFKDPFKEQLNHESKELMCDLLKKNRHHNLSDFQKQTLLHMRNSSLRSKMIIFGDCVD